LNLANSFGSMAMGWHPVRCDDLAPVDGGKMPVRPGGNVPGSFRGAA
jgi:hypothetical protein